MTWAMDDLMARANGQLEALYGVQESIGTLRIAEESDDGHVRVEVDGSGGLVGLWLSPTAARLGAAGLAQVIVATATTAAHRALAARASLTADFLARFADQIGPDSRSLPTQLVSRS